MRRATTRLALAFSLLAAPACSQLEGHSCVLDSDCESGLVCSLDGVCTTFEAIAAAFDATPEITPLDGDTSNTSDVEAVTGTCTDMSGVFDAAIGACPEPARKLVVTAMVIDKDGNGLGPLAAVANSVIANGFRNGDITLALWVDGTFESGCDYASAWVRGPDDIHVDCTPVFSDEMPFEIPGLVSTKIEDAVIDPETGLVTGLVDKPALLLSIDEALRDVAENLIIEDVDTDGDQVPDRASVRMFVTF